MKSGASSSPAPEAETIEHEIQHRESFCVESFDSYTEEEKQTERELTPRYSSAAEAQLFGAAAASKGPDGDNEGDDVTPVASNEFHMLTQMRGQQRKRESRSNDGHNEWNFDEDKDMAGHQGRRNIVGPGTEVGRGMLNQTLQFQRSPDTVRVSNEKWEISVTERQLIRQFVGRGLWQGNAFCAGMKVAVRPLSAQGMCDEYIGLERLAVVIESHRGCYDVEYLDATKNSSSLESKTSPSASPADPRRIHLSLHAEEAGKRRAHGRDTECDVVESRIVEPPECQGSNREFRAESVRAAEHILDKTAYPLLDDRYLKQFHATASSLRRDDNPAPEHEQEPVRGRRKS